MAREKQRIFKESLSPKLPNKKVNESASSLEEGKKHQFLGLMVGRDAYAPTEVGTMTVEELIEELQTYDMSLKVVFVNDGGYTYGGISSSDIREFSYEDDDDEDIEESKEKGHMKFKPERKPSIKK